MISGNLPPVVPERFPGQPVAGQYKPTGPYGKPYFFEIFFPFITEYFLFNMAISYFALD